MNKKKKSLLSTLGARLTSMVSVVLVLVVIGLMGLCGTAGWRFSSMLKERVGFVVIMDDSSTASDANALLRSWRSEPYIASVKYVSAQQALERWREATGDTDDIVELLGTNPFRPEMEVSVKARYATVDSLRPIIAQVAKAPGVAEVRMQARMINNINRSINRLTLVLGCVAVALLVISLVLINNTIRLGIYARRFIIHTMKLVGATRGFIRRPFILAWLINGVIAGLLADAVLAGIVAYGYANDVMMATLLPMTDMALLLAGVLLIGIVICVLSACMAANRYLSLDYDSLYK